MIHSKGPRYRAFFRQAMAAMYLCVHVDCHLVSKFQCKAMQSLVVRDPSILSKVRRSEK